MNAPLEKFRQNILKIKDRATERSYYKDISNFIVEFAESEGRKDFFATPEESSTVISHEIGFPDITVRQGNRLVGWIEVKLPDDNLDNEKFINQFKKYKDSLENVLFTNLREWQLWQWDDKGNSIKEIDLLFDVTNYNITEENKLKDVLIKFFEGRPYEVRTPKQLALALAKKTKLLSKQVEESFNEGDENSDLRKLKETFEKTLIQNISVHQFSNMVAETMAYSLFLAALEHIHRGNGTELTLTNAIDYLPTNVPILADLYSLIKKVSITIPTIYKATQLLVEQLNYSDIERVHQKLVEHKPGEDPVIQFYEPFLNEYDPKEREARGVYYTPKPVVDYIIRSVHWILCNKFNKTKGLADESVYLLDPATGTGTFLMSAIQEIHGDIKKENTSFGDEMVKREFNKVVLSHILKHFYGFELLIAPYAIAHLKLTLEVERLGFDFMLTKNDSDPDNDRFKVYLANTLDDPDKLPQNLFGFASIPQESENARKVKKDIPILAIVGNPPYSNFGQMNCGEWILKLVKDYKKDLGEKKTNLDDDFVKFIRFAQWKLEKTGMGIFAMITNNTFIDGLTHRHMRRSLLNTFDEIYIYNLHGSKRKIEVEKTDQNVFQIMTGVSINIFVKYLEKSNKTVVKYCDLWGSREYKFEKLLGEVFEKTEWINVNPREPNFYFVPKDMNMEQEYSQYKSIKEIFNIFGSSVKTERDKVSIHFDKIDLINTLKDFKNLDENAIRQKYILPKDSRDWKISKAKNDVIEHNADEKYIYSISYRPFDWQYIWYSSQSRGFVGTPGYPTMKHMLRPNLGMIATRQFSSHKYFVMFISNKLVEISSQPFAPNNIFPLYLYSEQGQQSTLLDSKISNKFHNFSDGFIKDLSEKLSLKFVTIGRGDLDKNIGPEDIFYYIYAIFHSPIYRSRYAEQLKIDFPRLPLTENKKLFIQLVKLGSELVSLHLLGENPFDESKTIFDEPNKWNIKIDGEKLENLDDWKINEVRYDVDEKRIYVNAGQYFEGIEKEVWEFMIGGYQVCDKWLKDRKKAERTLSTDDIKHYMKIVVSLRETIRIMKEIDQVIPSWPIK